MRRAGPGPVLGGRPRAGPTPRREPEPWPAAGRPRAPWAAPDEWPTAAGLRRAALHSRRGRRRGRAGRGRVGAGRGPAGAAASARPVRWTGTTGPGPAGATAPTGAAGDGRSASAARPPTRRHRRHRHRAGAVGAPRGIRLGAVAGREDRGGFGPEQRSVVRGRGRSGPGVVHLGQSVHHHGAGAGRAGEGGCTPGRPFQRDRVRASAAAAPLDPLPVGRSVEPRHATSRYGGGVSAAGPAGTGGRDVGRRVAGDPARRLAVHQAEPRGVDAMGSGADAGPAVAEAATVGRTRSTGTGRTGSGAWRDGGQVAKGPRGQRSVQPALHRRSAPSQSVERHTGRRWRIGHRPDATATTTSLAPRSSRRRQLCWMRVFRAPICATKRWRSGCSRSRISSRDQCR